MPNGGPPPLNLQTICDKTTQYVYFVINILISVYSIIFHF